MDRGFFLKNLWLWKCGLPEMNHEKQNYKTLLKSEWSREFEKLMRNRLIQGALRYGLINSKDKKKYDRVGAIVNKITAFKKDRNKELLVDIANLCLLEFVEGDGYFEALHDIEHVRVK